MTAAADGDVVEGHVVGSATAERQPVVVDDRDALLLGLVDHGRRRRRIEVDDQQHVRAAVEHLIGDRGELRLITVGVLDVRLHTGSLERIGKERTVRVLPARRRRRVREDHADLRLGLRRRGRTTATTPRARVVIATTGGDGERERAGQDSGGDPRGQLVLHVLPFLRLPQTGDYLRIRSIHSRMPESQAVVASAPLPNTSATAPNTSARSPSSP